ncbi:TPM domain-containing protein [Leptospira sp. 201903070]|uniref:TPM domain-containing protein n=1 Tax=Leptospira ainlahdjerensis TaxID=2810033 RepID=A0ABS2U9N9_9LEPT|nr:TPM domain-containing protein [Leptospira ainlahdjerensis]MBM9577080.1 TPM domain-containing protein [Leptospira ainlahdjerensis]
MTLKNQIKEKSKFLRIGNHLIESFFSAFSFSPDKSKSFLFKKFFSKEDLKKIESSVSQSEKFHTGEIKVILEGNFPLWRILRGLNAKRRAEELFSERRIWDTEENTGILIYVQLVDKKIELLADRGIYKKIGQDTLDEICDKMEKGFRSGEYLKSILDAVEEFTKLLRKHFPAGKQNANELSDRPELI